MDSLDRGAPLEALGWDGGFEEAFAVHAAASRLPARVVAVHKETSIVRGSDGDRPAVVAGRLRFEALAPSDYPAVGDWVALEDDRAATTASASSAVIAGILPRRSAIRRSAGESARRGSGRLADEQVLAANVDIAFLVAGLDGDLNLRRIERYLAVAWSSEVRPIVVLNKADLAGDVDASRRAVEAVASGVPIAVLSAHTGHGIEELEPYLEPGQTAVVLGSSGVGKSTLLNRLLGEARQQTRAVRVADSRGRHTTTHRELFVLPDGALLIDTPGLRALQVAGAAGGIGAAFGDIEALARECRFADCRHGEEPGCAVQAALRDGRLSPQRLASHRKLERELAHDRRETDPQARLEERRRWAKIHRESGRRTALKRGEDWR